MSDDGLRPSVREDGQQALVAGPDFVPELVLLDVLRPQRDGLPMRFASAPRATLATAARVLMLTSTCLSCHLQEQQLQKVVLDSIPLSVVPWWTFRCPPSSTPHV